MQTNDLPRIGVLSADPAAVTQFLRRVQALGADSRKKNIKKSTGKN